MLTVHESQREVLYADLAKESLAPLWSSLHELVPPHPCSAMRPAVWRYADLRPLLMRAGALISAEEAIRRVLILENPGAPGSSAVTSTLYAGLQLILPGEIAPAHRHTQSAFRFVIEGRGAFTTVRGERFAMSPGDLILTPNSEWHDHGHEGKEPVVWLDGLDIPLVRALQAGFAESASSLAQQLEVPDGYNRATWGSGLRIPDRSAAPCRLVERFVYPYSEWRTALDAYAKAARPDAAGVFTLEFSNPLDGSSVLPTMSAYCHLVPENTTTRWQRRTDGVVHHVVEGEGFVDAGEFRSAISPRDTFVVPGWTRFRLSAARDLVVFSYSDRATQARLGLWRSQADS